MLKKTQNRLFRGQWVDTVFTTGRVNSRVENAKTGSLIVEIALYVTI